MMLRRNLSQNHQNLFLKLIPTLRHGSATQMSFNGGRSWLEKNREENAASNSVKKRKYRYKDTRKLFMAEAKERKNAGMRRFREERRRETSDQFMAMPDENEAGLDDIIVHHVERDKRADRELQWKQLRKEQLSTRYQTIKNKFFKDPPEHNLLTWDAKEQIRYLHTEYPEEWTIERLAKSFPISQNGIRRLLRSPFRPRSIEELIKHDVRVKKNWKLLEDAERGDGPLLLRYTEMVREGKIQQLSFAVGNTALPMPNTNDLPERQLTQLEAPGAFSKIIKSYVEIQKRKEIEEKVKNKEQQKELYEKLKETNLKTLQALLKALPAQSLDRNRKSTKHVENKSGSLPQIASGDKGVDYRKAFWYQDYNITSPDLSVVKESRRDISAFDMLNELDKITEDESQEGESDLMPDNVQEDFEEWKKNTQHNLAIALGYENKPHGDKASQDKKVIHTESLKESEDVIDPGMAGTKILPLSKTKTESRNFEKYDYLVEKPKKYKDNEIYKSVEVERSAHADKDSAPDYYLFDEKTGYQYPYGKPDDKFDDIDVPQTKSTSGEKIYKRGKDYFDEDGEFLFRGQE